MKSKIENVTKKFISDKCDEKGNIKASNIDTKTKQGVKSLHDIVKKGELLVVPSDTLCNSVKIMFLRWSIMSKTIQSSF